MSPLFNSFLLHCKERSDKLGIEHKHCSSIVDCSTTGLHALRDEGVQAWSVDKNSNTPLKPHFSNQPQHPALKHTSILGIWLAHGLCDSMVEVYLWALLGIINWFSLYTVITFDSQLIIPMLFWQPYDTCFRSELFSPASGIHSNCIQGNCYFNW